MKDESYPRATKSQWNGENASYEIHHMEPINQGGEVYDFDNLVIVTPRYHKDILDPKYHTGRKK